MDKLTITQWAVEDRPREKMMMHGVGALSDAELLAILIGSGNTEDSAVELMRKVLAGYGNSLAALGKTARPRPSPSWRQPNWDDAARRRT
jgi:DNA repair protein RadC